MKYSDDLLSNEAEAVKNGERNKVTWEQLNNFIGNDTPHGDAIELVLDIINDIYSVEDCVKEIQEYANE